MQTTIAELCARLNQPYNNILGLMQYMHRARLAKRVGHRKSGPHRPEIIWEIPDVLTIDFTGGAHVQETRTADSNAS